MEQPSALEKRAGNIFHTVRRLAGPAIAAGCLLWTNVSFATTTPDPSFTPGELCSSQDPNFSKYEYSENVAICRRHVTEAMKEKIADEYGGIPRDQWKDYEFDHLIPLCAGGSSNLANLWPQPIDEAREKDKIEDAVCKGLRAGTLTQDEAVRKVMDWFNSN